MLRIVCSMRWLGRASRFLGPAAQRQFVETMTALANLDPPFRLLDVPVELVRQIVRHVHGGFKRDPGERHAVFRNRIALEGTCRALRRLSAGLPWLGPKFPFGPLALWNIFGQDNREALDRASELFFAPVPERLRSFSGVRFGPLSEADPSATWLERLYEAKRSLEPSPNDRVSIDEIDCHCHAAFLPMLYRPWSPNPLALLYRVGAGSMTKEDVVRVVSNLAPSLAHCSLRFSYESPELEIIQSVITGCLVALRGSSKGIRSLSLGRAYSEAVPDLVTVRQTLDLCLTHLLNYTVASDSLARS